MRMIFTLGCLFALLLPQVAFADYAAMQRDLDTRITNFAKYVEYTGKTLASVAQQPVFKEYFLAKGNDEKQVLKHKVDLVSLNTQLKFNVDEMCLIDSKGKEISRIVYREVAPDKDLSSEEASAPFFSPAFQVANGEYHVSAPYVSADSLRWVLCFATPITLADGSKPGIYHYEIPQYYIQGVLNKGLKNSDSRLLILNKEGYVVSDSRTKFKLEFNVNDVEMETPFSDYFPLAEGYITGLPISKIIDGGSGSGDLVAEDEYFDYIYKSVGYNDWTAVLIQKKG